MQQTIRGSAATSVLSVKVQLKATSSPSSCAKDFAPQSRCSEILERVFWPGSACGRKQSCCWMLILQWANGHRAVSSSNMAARLQRQQCQFEGGATHAGLISHNDQCATRKEVKEHKFRQG